MKVQVYTITNCGYCQKVKLFLSTLGVDYEEVKVLRLGESGEGINFHEFSLQNKSKNLLENYTFPQVYVDGNKLGGVLETITYFKELFDNEN